MAVQTVRITPDYPTVLNNLGLLQDLAGTWQGHGFNLIARPDYAGQADLYLQLNQTHETLKVDPIGSPIPNRGFGQDDIELFGLTYLQKVNDVFTGGALHIEPGIWVTQPPTTYPLETPPEEQQIIARMASIPHGNSLLAQGTAARFQGPPTLPTATDTYAFSQFPSFNSTSFPIPAPPEQPIINAAGSSDAGTARPHQAFKQYDLTVPDGPENPRTPFGTHPPDPPLPTTINGVPMQDIVNDPIVLLQKAIKDQVAQGHSFEGTVLNIATQATIAFFTKPNSKERKDPKITVDVPCGAGGIENILFLKGGEPSGKVGPNAQTSLVYATLWIEKVMHPDRPTFMQLQYAQMTILDFFVLKALPHKLNLGWPHVSVATLRKSFL